MGWCAGFLWECVKKHICVGAAIGANSGQGDLEWAYRLGARPGSRRPLALQVLQLLVTDLR